MNASQSRGDDDKEITFPVLPLVLLLSFLAVGALLGNVLVCLAVCIRPSLRNRNTYLPIASLALADLLVSVTAMPAYILKKVLQDQTPLTKEVICDLFRFSYFLTGYASVLSLCVISVERLLAIRNPLTYSTMVTRGRLLLALSVAWLDAILVSSLPFARWSGEENRECVYNPTRWWSIMVIVCNVFSPFLFILVCYLYMYRIARYHLRRIKSEVVNQPNSAPSFQEKKASKTVVIIVGVFIVSWFPSCFYYFLKLVCRLCFPESFAPLEGIFNTLVKLLTFSGSFFNPIIYCWRSRDFRRTFVQIITGRALCPCVGRLGRNEAENNSTSFSLQSVTARRRTTLDSDSRDHA